MKRGRERGGEKNERVNWEGERIKDKRKMFMKKRKYRRKVGIARFKKKREKVR